MKKKENQYPPIANVKLDEIGIWSEIKIAILREYASAFTRILKAKPWCRGCCYVDAFAGAGIHIKGLIIKKTLANIFNTPCLH